MPVILHLVRRDSLSSTDAGPLDVSTGTLLFIFFTLLLLASVLSVVLLQLRRRRLARAQGLLPDSGHTWHSRPGPTNKISALWTRDPAFAYGSKRIPSPVPEIRLTFPDDDDDAHKGSWRQGGVVVVHVTDTGSVGMSPLIEDKLPPYQRSESHGFQSLDLNQTGGWTPPPASTPAAWHYYCPMAAAVAFNGGSFVGSPSHLESEHDALDGDPGDSPAQIKKTVEAHLREIERQLEETQRLGTSLLQQHTEFTQKLSEVDDDQEAVPLELRKRLAQLGKDHDDVGREVARALLPRSRTVSGEDASHSESGIYSNQPSGSPTKATAPSRRQRNQPSKHAGDLQFAADISTSLLAQVRQLQAAVADRDETIKKLQAEQARLDQDSRALSQKVRLLDENEQRYKDENWNLETQTHHLQTAAREAADREKRLNASLAAALAANAKLQTEFDEAKLAHAKLNDEHAAAKKAHDTDLNALKRAVDLADDEKTALNAKIDELTAQNQELAVAVNARFRALNEPEEAAEGEQVQDEDRELSTPEHSPPPSPTKATPRHPALESETLRSSLHHAHRMIQNLKNSIHREKTEKIELKRMLQDARDELERSRDSPANAARRQRTNKDSRKVVRPDLLGASQRARTQIELDDDDEWEESTHDSPLHGRRVLSVPGAYKLTDASDAYATSTETETPFETADEKHGTESEDFQTGAESMPDDSTDDLTETEDNAVRARAPVGTLRLTSRNAGDRTSFLSTASTSAAEEDGPPTPILSQHKFRLKNGRQSLRQARPADRGTPQSIRDIAAIDHSSPASFSAQNSSPPAAGQSLYAELGDLDDVSSTFGTPRQASLASAHSTPLNIIAPASTSRSTALFSPASVATPAMVDSGTMTEPELHSPAPSLGRAPVLAAAATGAATGVATGAAAIALVQHRDPSPTDFPLPPSVPQSPLRNIDSGTQWTPQRSVKESPVQNLAPSITPPKTVWDEEGQTIQTPQSRTAADALHQPFHYSGVLTQDTLPVSPPRYQVESPTAPESRFSSIQTLQIQPVSPQPEFRSAGLISADTDAELEHIAATSGLSRSQQEEQTSNAYDNTADAESRPRTSEKVSGKRPLSSIDEYNASLNAAKASTSGARSGDGKDTLASLPAGDDGSQARLSSDRPDGTRASSSSKDPLPPLPLSPSKRPSSSSSHRTSSLLSQNHPPLPVDHKTAIEKAGGVVTAPVRDPGPSSQPVGTMGPPPLPASALRRPRTPHDQSVRSPVVASRASHARTPQRTATQTSQTSRRSSMSSFASELDERFNIRPGQHPTGAGFDPSSATDPRMIQAITQTMIGEFLWKYTRKPGRSEMSGTRHRRYFWVHPYTKTLYWSNQDPQTAGRSQLKAKSVAIQSVRVVTDDNPMPPGLHRKSLEVTTPGRKIKFTASTGQRHETWFNALSYLLLRGEHQADGTATAYVTGNTEITKDDINEFNVYGNGYGAHLVPTGSRVSMSSYNSRTTRGTAAQKEATRHSQQYASGARASTSQTINSRQVQQATVTARTGDDRLSRADQGYEADKDRTIRAGSVSRFSRMIGSVTKRTSRSVNHPGEAVTRSESGSIYDASVVSDAHRDSAEEMRREMLAQERDGLGGRLENVRACCDGKHDVSTLSRGHSHRTSTPTSQPTRGISLRDTISRRTSGVN
ncbi:hypothetical protein DV738_g3814, partial [Chaetothyriales sp. CBS 135597]